MKTFGILQKHFTILGIVRPPNPSSQKDPFNKKVLFGFSLIAYFIGSQFAYIFYVADGFMEYMNCICATFASMIVFVCFVAIVFGTSTVFTIIDDMERVIDLSEQHIF